ncbi:MAG: asparagine synthase (glutamine-hydrolyzing) [Vicinamibacterales bacterium]
MAGAFGEGPLGEITQAMTRSLQHRGPDGSGFYADAAGGAALGHTRLSIIDLSPAGAQPMVSASGRYWIAFNGEVYNYVELRQELRAYPFRTRTDTEVVLAAYERWGAACLDRFIGMFALLIWDTEQRRLFAARDRFGVKPLYYYRTADALLVASEIKALHASGAPAEPDPVSWATYLSTGLHDHSPATFWRDIHNLPAGHAMEWQDGRLTIRKWYDLAARCGDAVDDRPVSDVHDEYLALLAESVRLRFRADVPVGICLSGGLDSSALLAAVQQVQGREANVAAFTFTAGDDRYDELPWVRQMLAHTRHPLVECRLAVADVPRLAESVAAAEDEPFGGLPTLAYARLFEQAREHGAIVLLDGQGMDEQWAGYEYYRSSHGSPAHAPVQGTSRSPYRPDCLAPEFRALAAEWSPPRPFADRLRDLQLRDALFTKLPRALRFSDRASMRSSVELREPFLDHRMFELALRQPTERKIQGDTGKWLLRHMLARLVPEGVVTAPKRPLQTPQREWLQGPLHTWAADMVDSALRSFAGWFDEEAVRRALHEYGAAGGESSVHVWQWIGLALLNRVRLRRGGLLPTAV